MPKGKTDKPRAANRPAPEVFVSKIENAYASYLGLADKLRTLSKHRALKSPEAEALAAKLNGFIEAMRKDMSSFEVDLAAAIEQEVAAKSVDAFISG